MSPLNLSLGFGFWSKAYQKSNNQAATCAFIHIERSKPKCIGADKQGIKLGQKIRKQKEQFKVMG